MARKRVTIVFEETDKQSLHDGAGEQGFNVFIEGADETKVKPQAAWTAAEFWGLKCFGIIVKIINEAGAMRTAVRKGGS